VAFFLGPQAVAQTSNASAKKNHKHQLPRFIVITPSVSLSRTQPKIPERRLFASWLHGERLAVKFAVAKNHDRSAKRPGTRPAPRPRPFVRRKPAGYQVIVSDASSR
jgi:hypothetical protein